MGRMLEVFRQPARRQSTLAIAGTPRPSAESKPADPVDEIPFIEVGIPGSFEASPSVLASKPAIIPLPVKAEPQTKVEQKPTILTFKPVRGAEARKPGEDLIALHRPNDPLAEQYMTLMEQMTPDPLPMGPRVLLMTTPPRSVDSTPVLLNLAVCHARHGQRVLAVDARPTSSTMADKLGVADAPGLREVLCGMVTWTKAIQETAQRHLSVMTSGSADIESGSWMARKALWALLRQLRKRFELVLIDAPAWHGGADLMALASACDEVYLVLGPNEVEDERIADLMIQIPRQGGHLCGCIVASLHAAKRRNDE